MSNVIDIKTEDATASATQNHWFYLATLGDVVIPAGAEFDIELTAYIAQAGTLGIYAESDGQVEYAIVSGVLHKVGAPVVVQGYADGGVIGDTYSFGAASGGYPVTLKVSGKAKASANAIRFAIDAALGSSQALQYTATMRYLVKS